MNPVWDQTYDMSIPNKNDTMILKVWNKNKVMKDELLGTATVKLEILDTMKNFEEQVVTISLGGRVERLYLSETLY